MLIDNKEVIVYFRWHKRHYLAAYQEQCFDDRGCCRVFIDRLIYRTACGTKSFIPASILGLKI